MKKTLLAILVLLVISSLTFYYHRENQIVDVGFMYYDLNQVDSSVRSWALSNSTSGIFLAKKINSKGLENYYVYINELPFDGVKASNEGYKGLKLEVKTKASLANRSKIYELITMNKNAEYLLLNDARIETSTIPLISQ